MLDVTPMVRHLILCEDIHRDPQKPRHVTLVRLLSTIRSSSSSSYLLVHSVFCIFLQLIECRGSGEIGITILQADTEDQIFQTEWRIVSFGSDPLQVIGLSFRIRKCRFPNPGFYWIQLWYNNDMLLQQPLLLE